MFSSNPSHSTRSSSTSASIAPLCTLRRESTEEFSKLYTTIYEDEDIDPQLLSSEPQLHQDYFSPQISFQDLRESQEYLQAILSPQTSPWDPTLTFQPTPIESALQSPLSPDSSFFSTSSASSSSPQSSPTADVINMDRFDPADADELVDLFNITIDDLLSHDPMSLRATVAHNNFALFGGMPHMHQNQMHCSNPTYEQHYLMQQQQQQQQLNYQLMVQQQHGGSPLIPSSPYQTVPQSFGAAHDHASFPSSPMTTSFSAPATPSPYSASSSSPQTSPSVCSVSSPPTPTVRVEQIGSEAAGTMMTMIRNEDGSILVYNPKTESVQFRCELCPGETFGRIHDLKRHQASKHQAQTWPCEFCQKEFVRRDALLRHYTVKSARKDGIHPESHETEKLMAARARAKLIH